MAQSLDRFVTQNVRQCFQKLVTHLERHDCGAIADAYFCTDEEGQVLSGVGENGFEQCTDANKDGPSLEFKTMCLVAGGTVKGGCILEDPD